MKNLKTQIGTSIGADFNTDTWTFKFDENMIVEKGEFAILPRDVYIQMIKALEHGIKLSEIQVVMKVDMQAMSALFQGAINKTKGL